jgi:PEGA domain-containing protein
MITSLLIGSMLCWCATAAAQTKKNPQPPKKAAPASDRRLTIDQIRQLISIQTPDSAIAQEIQARGMKDEYNRGAVEQLRRAGAGSETVAALTRLLPVANLTVSTEPGATVRLDGTAQFQVGPDGVLTLSGLDPGSHQLAIQKQFFTAVTRTVELKGGTNSAVEAKLDWAVGFLTISVDVPDARIQVGNNPVQAGPINRMAVPVAAISVVATAPLRKTASQTVAIEPGKEASVAFAMVYDQAELDKMASQIHTLFRSKNYVGVLQQAGRYPQREGKDKDVIADVAISELETGRFAEFKSAAREALAAGAALRFDLMHHHAGLHIVLHPAVVQLKGRMLSFQPEGACNFEPFEVSLAQVKVGNKQFVIDSPNHSVPAVSLVVPNPSNPKKEATLNFVTRTTIFAEAQAIRGFLLDSR